MTFRLKVLACAAVAGAAVTALGFGVYAAQSEATPLQWRVAPRAENAAEVNLTLTLRSGGGIHSFGRNVPLSTLQGLSGAQLHAGQTQPARFRLARDAGTFVCEGQAGREQGAGACVFEPGRVFARRLSAEGYGEAADAHLLELAMSDVGVAYLDELKRQQYAKPGVPGLVDAARHGVNLTYLQGMGAAGYRLNDLAALSRLRDHGVDPRFVAELKAAGYARLSAEEITRLRDHGVSAEFIRRMGELGYGDLATADLIKLRDHGVSAGFVAQLRELGYADLTADELARLRDHGVTVGFIRRANADGPPIAPRELIRMRDRGER